MPLKMRSAREMRSHHADGTVAGPGFQDLCRPRDRLTPFTNGDQTAHQRSHHVVAEGIRSHSADKYAALVSLPLQVEQRPDRGGALPAFAEGREVVFPQQRLGSVIHQGLIQVARPVQDEPSGQRVSTTRVVGNAIAIATPDRPDPDVRFEDAVDSAYQRGQRAHI